MSELTDEQMRAQSDFDVRNRLVAENAMLREHSAEMQKEMDALRAERAKPTQSDEKRARELADDMPCWRLPTMDCENGVGCDCQKALSAVLASIRAEGSAERAKLEAALRRIDWMAFGSADMSDAEAARSIRRIEAIVRLFPAQPAESGATEQKKKWADTFSAEDVLLDAYFPGAKP